LAALRPELHHGARAFHRTIAYSFEEELANDVLEIITVFSARLYGSRSHRNQKLIDGVRQAVKEAQ